MNKILMLTREYPPHVYGGAGVHVENLTRELSRLLDVEVRCFGHQAHGGAPGQPEVTGCEVPADRFDRVDPRLRRAVEPLAVNLEFLRSPVDADIVHCHTWYTLMAGLWIKLLYDIPLVITTHSLEPLRPWKEEQLGRGYSLSSWIERTALESADAVVAVSRDTRREVLECYSIDPSRVRVIHNGIDLEGYRPKDAGTTLKKYGIPQDRPYILFVGRITRQKGVVHLVRALQHVTPEFQAVLCAGAPDTDGILREMETAVNEAQSRRPGIHWIPEMVAVDDLISLYSGAAVFVCPSVYEPFGIINLEAMACRCPVVAARVGGIPEVVVHGETGLLVDLEPGAPPSFEPRDPERFSRDLAGAVNRLAADPDLRRRMGEAGRRRVEERFSWESIARQTHDLYQELGVPAAPA
ncbi:MAG: glycogen synthase, partial [Planctomycetes bacterium]|nr:glycogen synthase [Planctomycetota bacterium]